MASVATSDHPQQQQQQQQQQQVRVKQEEGQEGMTAPVAPVKKMVKDPYHGHEETAKMSARFIISLFNCPVIPPQTSVNSPQPPLAHFIAYALHRTRLPHFVTLVGLLLLQRLKARYPSARGSSGHRLFVSAFMIASKIVCDDTYSNQSWCVVAQKMFTLKEMNQMEREMCGYLEWNLNASSSEIDAFEARLKADHSTMAYNARKAAVKAQQQAQQFEQAQREQQQQQQQFHAASSHQHTQRPSSSGVRPMSGIDSSSSSSAARVTAGLPQRTPFNKAWAASANATASSSSNTPAVSTNVRRMPTPMAVSPAITSATTQPIRVAGTSSVPTASVAPLSVSMNGQASGGPPPSSSSSASLVPTFHPGSSAPVVGNSPLTSSRDVRRGSKPGLAVNGAPGKLNTTSRSSSTWSLNTLNTAAANGTHPNGVGMPTTTNGSVKHHGSSIDAHDERNFRSGELARSGSGAGTYVNPLTGRLDGKGGYDCDEDDLDGHPMAVSPGPVMDERRASVHSLSTTWPRSHQSGYYPSSARSVSSGSVASHLHHQYLQPASVRAAPRRQNFRGVQSNPNSPGPNRHAQTSSPYPSLTNDSSTQSSPDSQLCRTPSPLEDSIHHESAPSKVERYSVSSRSKPMVIQGSAQRQHESSRYGVAVD